MELETLVANATDGELATIVGVLQRAAAKPAVLVTVQHGKGKRRYVVAQEDEEALRPYVGCSEIPRSMFGFGCRWLRGFGNVDEMYRTLSLWKVVKVEEADRKRVWGEVA